MTKEPDKLTRLETLRARWRNGEESITELARELAADPHDLFDDDIDKAAGSYEESYTDTVVNAIQPACNKMRAYAARAAYQLLNEWQITGVAGVQEDMDTCLYEISEQLSLATDPYADNYAALERIGEEIVWHGLSLLLGAYTLKRVQRLEDDADREAFNDDLG